MIVEIGTTILGKYIFLKSDALVTNILAELCKFMAKYAQMIWPLIKNIKSGIPLVGIFAIFSKTIVNTKVLIIG